MSSYLGGQYSFCSLKKVHGFWHKVWFNGLKNQYPLEFLLFTQYSTNHPNPRLFAKTIFSNEINRKIGKLLEYHIEQEDVDYLNSIISQLEDRITQKKLQIKN